MCSAHTQNWFIMNLDHTAHTISSFSQFFLTNALIGFLLLAYFNENATP